jgi:regulator of protease activity HflC (stomatin/prohibitin superfamily)
MLGIERAVDAIFDSIEAFQFCVFVDQYDRAVVLRAGKYDRTLDPGFHFILPLFEDLIDVNVKPEPLYIDTLTVHTKDDYLVSCQAGLEIRVYCPKTYLLEYDETDELISLLVAGVISDALRGATWAQVRSGEWKKGILSKAKKIAHQRGATIEKLVVTDLASGEANRLWVEGVEL